MCQVVKSALPPIWDEVSIRVMDTPQQVITDLHFQTGVLGRVARFVVRRRVAGDPFDATVVLPLLIFIILLRLDQLGRVANWQKAAPLRAKIEQITRLVFRIKDGVPTSRGLLFSLSRWWDRSYC